MKKRLTLAAIAFALLPMVAEAGIPHGSVLVKAGYELQQGWGGKHKDRDNQRSNWSNDNNNGGRRSGGGGDNWRDQADQARSIAMRYRNVVQVQNVTHEDGPFFRARVVTSDGRRVDLRINVDTGSYTEE